MAPFLPRLQVGNVSSRSPITCHGCLNAWKALICWPFDWYWIELVLDSSLGKPAEDVQVILQKTNLSTRPRFPRPGICVCCLFQIFHIITAHVITDHRSTNSDGRCLHLLEPGTILVIGVYKVIFKTQAYFEATERTCFTQLLRYVQQWPNNVLTINQISWLLCRSHSILLPLASTIIYPS